MTSSLYRSKVVKPYIMKIKIKPLIIFAILFFILIPTVYAVGSSDYLTKAQKYIDNNCSRRSLSNDVSLSCYLFYKLGEIDSRVNSNTSRISALENISSPTPFPSTTPSPHKELKTYDNDGNELGLYVDRTSFFYLPLGIIIPLNDYKIGSARDDVYYQNGTCTGTPYVLMGNTDYQRRVNEIFSNGPGRYFTINRGSSSTVVAASFQRYNGSSFPCVANSVNENGYSLTPVTLPFSDPITSPLQFIYQ